MYISPILKTIIEFINRVTVITGAIFGAIVTPNIAHYFTKRGRPPTQRRPIIWVIFWISTILFIASGIVLINAKDEQVVATSTPYESQIVSPSATIDHSTDNTSTPTSLIPPSPPDEIIFTSTPTSNQSCNEIIIEGQCVQSPNWRGYYNGISSSKSVECWSVGSEWGFSNKDDKLLFYRQLPQKDVSSGLFFTFTGDAAISLDLIITQMNIINTEERLLNLVFGITSSTPENLPLTGLLIQMEREDLPIFYKWKTYEEPDLAEDIYFRDGDILEYILNSEVHLDFLITGNEMQIILNRIELSPQIEIVGGERAFWIGFNLSKGETLRAEISNIEIISNSPQCESQNK